MSEALDAAGLADAPAEQPAIEVIVDDIDEDVILEELIREEELLKQDEAEREPVETAAEVGLSVDDLDSFTLDDMTVIDEEEDEEPEDDGLSFGDLPVLTPDAGKIRFAEDIAEDIRGGGRRGGGGRSRRGGGGGGSRRR